MSNLSFSLVVVGVMLAAGLMLVGLAMILGGILSNLGQREAPIKGGIDAVIAKSYPPKKR